MPVWQARLHSGTCYLSLCLSCWAWLGEEGKRAWRSAQWRQCIPCFSSIRSSPRFGTHSSLCTAKSLPLLTPLLACGRRRQQHASPPTTQGGESCSFSPATKDHYWWQCVTHGEVDTLPQLEPHCAGQHLSLASHTQTLLTANSGFLRWWIGISPECHSCNPNRKSPAELNTEQRYNLWSKSFHPSAQQNVHS